MSETAFDRNWRLHHPWVKPLRDLGWRWFLSGHPIKWWIGNKLLSIAFLLAVVGRRCQ